ncbi:MOSC domain-containing protein [Mangrovicoccus algicola]|uniref:MOSC domain-containing protein n=1 Tax=Mangrovicoccus algicola TaxID=2771008 RepID=A0A8J6YWM2_9RHOB|nr:MOSC domain-containing protein [Mangrovicoccus algicola]MBE3637388.1 MOSC domain-containing protein [Mangrovicoccus algicola]
MTMRLAHIWRHPVKGIGTERLGSAHLEPGRPVSGDRAWAMLREGVEATGGWQKCAGFLRGANGPRLMAVTAQTTGDGLILRHPDRAPLQFDPATEGDRLIAWLGDLWPEGLPRPERLVKAPPEGMSDMAYPSVSVLNLASLAELAAALGQETLDMRRFRGNLWIGGAAAWAEWDWVGRRLAIGDAVLEVVERNTRCLATHASPETGTRDLDVLRTLSGRWGHRDFGVYARVLSPGRIAPGDTATLI